MKKIVITVSTWKAIAFSLVFGASQVLAADAAERDAWNAARMLGTKSAYQSFLENYPNSPYAAEAFSSMVEAVDRSVQDAPGASDGTGESY